MLKSDCFPIDKKETCLFSQILSLFVIIKIGQDNGLHPTLSEQQCTEQEGLRIIFLSNIAVNFTVANL